MKKRAQDIFEDAISSQKRNMTEPEPAAANEQPEFGFTLLEVMVALSIIALVLVSVYKMHAQTLAMNYAANFYTTAPLLAQGKIAELETKTLDELVEDSGSFGDEFPGYKWNVGIDDVESEALGTIAEDLKRIDVTVSLNNDEFTYILRTYRFFWE